jgi:FXSXX-COOH protein
MHQVADGERVGADSKISVREGGSDMADQQESPASSLLDVTEIPLRDLADLDDSLLERALARLVPRCGGMGSRLWQNGGRQRHDDGPVS